MTQKSVFMEGVFTLRNLRSASAAAIIEILIGAGIAAILIWQQVHTIVLPPVVTPPIDIVDQTPPPLQHTVVPDPQQLPTQPLHEVQPIRTPIPTSTALPLQPLQPPLVPEQRARASGDLAAEFNASMLRAINEQKVYPKISMLRADTGEATVSFDYSGGVVSNIRIDRSSGSRELDKAAVEAVQRAVLPPKPAELAGIGHFVLRIDFSMGG